MTRPDDLTEQDELIINSLVVTFTARQLAEELLRRCGCAFDHRLPHDAPPGLRVRLPPALAGGPMKSRRHGHELRPLRERLNAAATIRRRERIAWRKKGVRAVLAARRISREGST